MRRGALLLLAALIAACAPPAPQRCQRYDALSLNRENGFAASLNWKNPRTISRSASPRGRPRAIA